MRTVFLFWRNAHDLKSALFFRFEKNLRPVSRFWKLWCSKMRTLFLFWRNAHDLKSALFFRVEEILSQFHDFAKLWRPKMRFGQNVLRMTWKERFVQFSWKAHCFPVLARIWGQFHDFENFGAQKSDLAKTCCPWPEKGVSYNFLRKRTVFSAWKRIWGQFHDFENFDAQKCDFAKTCCAWPEKSVQYNFHGRRTVFSFSREFQTRVTILRTLKLQNAIWPKPAAHDLKRACYTIFMKSALFFRLEENLRPVSRFWKLWRSKMRFRQNVLRMTWKERPVQFSWKAHCFLVFERISGPRDDFENFKAPKCDLAKTCCAWPEKSVLYNFHEKRTVFPLWREFETSFTIFRTLAPKKCCAWPEKSVLYNFQKRGTVFSFWREFQARVTILKTLTLKNAIWPKPAAHDLKRAFCTIFMESALFSSFGENFRPVWRFWKFDAQKCDLAKTCCAWPEKSVLYNFHEKRTVFPISREFQASVTILRTLTLRNAHRFSVLKKKSAWPEKRTVFPLWREFEASFTISVFKRNLPLKNAIWPKRAAHDLKRAFCTIFMESALFSSFGENLRPVSRFWELWRWKIRFGQNVLRMTWNAGFVQFSCKAHCFSALKKIWGQFHDFQNFDLAKKCCAWPEKSVLYNLHWRRTVFSFWREFQARVTILKTFTLKNAIWPKRAAHDLKRAFL